ncbi:CmpA/NrtA family ABC transporter substrate-binding protein [Synechococcus sp. CCY 9618]|uniref:CmpA/NrtA family ABC transporter substrate-binding protein n=1 Tax=Synechococcus sp. CCY 9618 TaxID=2815602 RepID=UPI001C249B03|nr:CmpA/NrtA family ABC transporter substrate-binding protein [Synechococcus sp. CCY 9618]
MTNRRRFITLLGGAFGSSVLLSGCFGNPPGATDSSATPQAASPAAGNLETTTIKLGYIPILEAAPLVVGVEKGFFAKHGLKVELAKQASWPAARDNVVLGSSGGGIDGGQWQLPMPHMITEGVITDGKKVPMYVLAQLISQANGIAVSNSLKNDNLGVDLSSKVDVFKRFPQKEGRKFRAAHTYPNANQDMWIRYWLAAGGIDPDKDIELLTVPSTETLQGMRNGTMEAFSTGDPWPFRIVRDDIGYTAALTAQIWPDHPEEFLAVRADWVDKNPKAAVALVKGLIEAQQWADKQENRGEVAKLISSRAYFNTPVDVLEPALKGQYLLGADKKPENDPKKGPIYWMSDRGVISYPYKSLSLWFLVESLRWNMHPGKLTSINQARAIVNKVNREDIWRQAATELGLPAKDIPTTSSRGKETFFDGIIYDPENPQAYLNSLKIKR